MLTDEIERRLTLTRETKGRLPRFDTMYKLRDETFEDSDFEGMDTQELKILLAEVRNQKWHVEYEVKLAQYEYKNRIGPGLTATVHARKELEIAELKDLEGKLELLILMRE